MDDLFYKYKIYSRYGIEYTCLKWIENSIVGSNRVIDKPTEELTEEDLSIIQGFIDGGSVIRDKTDAIEP